MIQTINPKPENNKPSQGNLLSMLGLILILVVTAVAIGWILSYKNYIEQSFNWNLGGSLSKFASCSSLYDKIKTSYNQTGRGTMMEELSLGSGTKLFNPSPTTSLGYGGGADYSQTNIQVTGVDEADLVKTDGKYIYTIANQKITISQAYPAKDAKLLSKITFETNTTLSDLFIDGENILVFGTRYYNIDKSAQQDFPEEIYPRNSNLTFIEIYNVSDPTKPTLKRKLELEGNYIASRKIDQYVYFVLNSYPDYRILQEEPVAISATEVVPLYRDYNQAQVTDSNKKFEPLATCNQVSYIDPVISDQYLTVIGLPINDYKAEINKEVILGGSQNIYASLNNLYVANTNYLYGEAIKGLFPPASTEETMIYKFSLDKGKVKFSKKAAVPGTILNQFSMDENKNYFRIATTKGHVTQQGGDSTNNVYILDENLNKTGALENIAPGERIYSVRFMGDKAFLVTFKKVDPFFTIDVADPKSPKIIGKLKIPGYSDYLHPYDENHIIGIGKETEEAEEGISSTGLGASFAWYQGMKMAIFDVTDFANPKEMFKVEIGDRGTDSEILRDHKAFLFSKEKNLLVLPVLLAEISPELKANKKGNTYGEYVYQGSYVYRITLEKGFELVGRITHFDSTEPFIKSGYYMGEQDQSIKRNLYIDNLLYSISDDQIKINDLADLKEEGVISLH